MGNLRQKYTDTEWDKLVANNKANNEVARKRKEQKLLSDAEEKDSSAKSR